MIYYINGKYTQSDKAKIPFSDAGFLYGDGLFETMRFDNRNIFSPLKHIHRLKKGLRIIKLSLKHKEIHLIELLNSVIEKNNLESGIIRMMITRGNTDKKIGLINNPSIFISIKPFYKLPKGSVKIVYITESNFPIIRFTPAIKSMNYIGNMLAKQFAASKGAFEPVFYNNNYLITECAIRNIFYIKDNLLITPSLDLGILSGVMRETIINVASSMKLDIKECHISYNTINNMDEAFISSTGIGLLPCNWDGWSSNFKLTLQIKKELFNRINNS